MLENTDTVIPRADLLEMLSAVGGPDAAVNWLCAAIGLASPPPVLDELAAALREGRAVRVTLAIAPRADGGAPFTVAISVA